MDWYRWNRTLIYGGEPGRVEFRVIAVTQSQSQVTVFKRSIKDCRWYLSKFQRSKRSDQIKSVGTTPRTGDPGGSLTLVQSLLLK